MLENLSMIFSTIFQFKVIFFMFLGTFVGIVVGALPGLTPPIGMAIFIPLTMGLPPLIGLSLLAAIYMGAEYGGSISAILINTPGTASAACTAIDGNPLAQQGRGNEALFASVTASSIGGIIGVLILIFFTPTLAKWSLKFGAAEMFWLGIMGLSIVSNLCGKDFLKGLIGVTFGIFLCTIGYDPIGAYPRFVLNNVNLLNGIELVPALIGLFSISQMLAMISNKRQGEFAKTAQKQIKYLDILKYVIKRPILILRSSLIGTGIGMLPGAGASVASFISYSLTMKSSKTPETFGKGAVEGVIASESANNSMVGGSLVPLLAFGIPGSASAAILFTGLTIHGITPGPRLFIEHSEVAYGLMFSLLVSTFFMWFIGLFTAKFAPFILRVNENFIISTVLVLSAIGSFSVNNNIFDIWVMALFGVIGFLAIRFGFTITPIVLGIILGPLIEESLRRALNLAGDNFLGYLFSRPVSIILIIITLTIFVTGIYKEFSRKKLTEPDHSLDI